MFNLKEFFMILPVIMFLALCIYYLSCNEGRYNYDISNVIANICHLIMKFNDLIHNVWSELKRNAIEWLGVVFQLAISALSLFVLGDANVWNVWWISSIAIFATLCYCFKVCVEMKRAQLTRTCYYTSRRNNRKVWFFTITHGLEFLLPLLYLFLAYAYFMELYFKNHHTHNDWKNVAFVIKLGIGLVSSVLAILSACKIYYVIPDDQNQVIPISTIDNFPRYWNERILSEMPPRDLENPAVPYANAVEMVHRDVEDQAIADTLQRNVENQPIADQPDMVQQDDADNQSYEDANVQ